MWHASTGEKRTLDVVFGRAKAAAGKTFAYLSRNFRRSCRNGVSMNSQMEGVNTMADDQVLLDWVSPRKQREIDNQAAFLRYLLEREEAQAGGTS
jgi:hypothetical protein